MKTRWLLLATLVVAFGVGVWMSRWEDRRRLEKLAAQGTPTPRHVEPGVDDQGRDVGPLPPPPDRLAGASAQTRAIEEKLLRMQQGQVPAAHLAAFKAALLASDPGKTIAAIRGFLASKRDVLTGQSFEIATGGGTLATQPTLRLLLLDVLGQQARKLRSPEAAVVSRTILETKDSADEWALALRNVAWAEPQSRPYLVGKVRDMLRYEPWRTAPSEGMLEALDVAVFTRDASLVPELAAAREANGELAHAVDIALDRLADAAPLEMLTYLNQHPTTLAERPLLRADYFAKANLGDGAQRAQLEIYLGRPDIAPAEKTKLLRGLVTPGSFVSDTLLTAPVPADDGSARRAALTQVTAEWLRSNQFPSLRAELEAMQGRLGRGAE